MIKRQFFFKAKTPNKEYRLDIKEKSSHWFEKTSSGWKPISGEPDYKLTKQL